LLSPLSLSLCTLYTPPISLTNEQRRKRRQRCKKHFPYVSNKPSHTPLIHFTIPNILYILHSMPHIEAVETTSFNAFLIYYTSPSIYFLPLSPGFLTHKHITCDNYLHFLSFFSPTSNSFISQFSRSSESHLRSVF
jgi:hypothetical protein